MNALKERAGVVAALADGTQTVLVRRPDLLPGEADGWFALYPAYTHQHPGRYTPRFEHYFHSSRAKPDDGIPIRAVARVVSEFEVTSDATGRLSPHYVYSEQGLREKYDLGEARVILVRVASLEEPKLIEEQPSYRGCRTWIELTDDVDLHVEPDADVEGGATSPVLDAAAFAERRAAVEAALADGNRA